MRTDKRSISNRVCVLPFVCTLPDKHIFCALYLTLSSLLSEYLRHIYIMLCLWCIHISPPIRGRLCDRLDLSREFTRRECHTCSLASLSLWYCVESRDTISSRHITEYILLSGLSPRWSSLFHTCLSSLEMLQSTLLGLSQSSDQ